MVFPQILWFIMLLTLDSDFVRMDFPTLSYMGSLVGYWILFVHWNVRGEEVRGVVLEVVLWPVLTGMARLGSLGNVEWQRGEEGGRTWGYFLFFNYYYPYIFIFIFYTWQTFMQNSKYRSCHVIVFDRFVNGLDGVRQNKMPRVNQWGKVCHCDFQGAMWGLTILWGGCTRVFKLSESS